MIPKEVVDSILESAQIDEVVGDFLSLKKRGANYLALCPFHNEKTPSFTVSPNKGIYKCFGCGRGGDSVNFVMEHEHFSYPEALKYLANKYGIEVPEEEKSDEEQQAYNERESLYIVLDHAAKYYRKHLLDSEEGKLYALSYVRERGITDDSSELFELGFAPTAWDLFTKDALKAGYSEEKLVEAGLSLTSKNENLIDRFRGRIMFPIHSLSGRVIGFGGRILKQKDKKEAKYINSPDTPVYNKSKVLYGLYQAKRAIKEKELCYLVEGYTDVIAMHQAGVKNVCAASGTSLTEGHLRLIRRYTTRICFLFDGDAAGIKASLRAIDMAVEEGFDVFALALPEGEDPDSFSRKSGQHGLESYLKDHQKDFILFKSELLLGEDDDPLQKADAIRQVMQSVALIPNQLKRTLYIQQCARLFKVEEEVLHTELNRMLGTVLKKKEEKWRKENENIQEEVPEGFMSDPIQVSAGNEIDLLAEQEQGLIRFLLRFGHLIYDADSFETVAEHIVRFMTEYDASPDHEPLRMIFEEYKRHLLDWGVIDIKSFYRHDNEEIKKLAIELTEEKYKASENWIKRIGIRIKPEDNYTLNLKRVISRYKLSLLTRMVDQVMEELKSGEDEDLSHNLEVFKHVIAKRKEVAEELGIVVY